MRSLLAAFLAFACAALVAGCGGELASVDPVAQAASKTAADRSFKFTIRDGSGPVGEGAYDAGARRLRMRLDLPVGNASPASVEVVTDSSSGLVVYARMAFLSAFLPQGKSWVKVDVERAAKGKDVDVGQLLQAAQGNPAQLLAALAQAKGSEKVGSETVGGVETTRYRTELDVRDLLLQHVHGEARTKVERALDEAKPKPVPVDVWVDGEGLVRRLQATVPAEQGFRGGTLTEELTGYGEQAEVRLPPAADVVDVSNGKLHP